MIGSGLLETRGPSEGLGRPLCDLHPPATAGQPAMDEPVGDVERASGSSMSLGPDGDEGQAERSGLLPSSSPHRSPGSSRGAEPLVGQRKFRASVRLPQTSAEEGLVTGPRRPQTFTATESSCSYRICPGEW